jgi:signal transduction histidine kinase
MKRKFINRLSQRYALALRKHLGQGREASLEPARGLGRQAVVLGLETLDVARMHERALAALSALVSRDGHIKRAEIFFTEAITPIEKTHRAAVKTNARLGELHKALSQRTTDLAVSQRSLKHGIAQRKTVEEALKKSGGHSKRLLQESHGLQKHLRRVTHRLLTAQEDKRKRISNDLRDEVAQTLLGINVRLLTLRKEAAVNAKNFNQAIDNTQLLVEQSVKRIKRFAREFDKQYEA